MKYRSHELYLIECMNPSTKSNKKRMEYFKSKKEMICKWWKRRCKGCSTEFQICNYETYDSRYFNKIWNGRITCFLMTLKYLHLVLSLKLWHIFLWICNRVTVFLKSCHQIFLWFFEKDHRIDAIINLHYINWVSIVRLC